MNLSKNCFLKYWLNFINKDIRNNSEGDYYLILDQAISHISKNNKNQMISENKNVTYIPPAMTRFFQSLDVCVNKPLKDAIKEKYLDYCIKIKDYNEKISRSKKVDDKIINNELVYKSF